MRLMKTWVIKRSSPTDVTEIKKIEDDAQKRLHDSKKKNDDEDDNKIMNKRQKKLEINGVILAVLGPTQPPIQCVAEALFAWVKTSAEVKNTRIYTSTLP
jgi:hypothetical protein